MLRRNELHEILEDAVGERNSDIIILALQVRDIIRGDRLTIKILSRNIESLTMQMKEITQVTFERDAYKKGMEAQKEIIQNIVEERNTLRERLAKYE